MNNLKPKTAMIFAAGFGKRMQPLTKTTPKPLIKVNGKALLDYNLELLEKWGFENVIINTHYLAEQIEEHLKNYQGSLNVKTIFEDPILETGGGIVNALDLLGDQPFLTINSDIILIDKHNNMMSEICENWNPDFTDVIMVLNDCSSAVGYNGTGDFNVNENGNILKTDAEKHDYVFSGIMLSKPEAFKSAPLEPFSVYRDFLKQKYIDESGVHSKIKGVINTGDWYHVGAVDHIKQAEDKLG